jgi:hypothetical protein
MIASITLEESVAVFKTRGRTTTKQVVKALREFGISCGDKRLSLKKHPKSSVCMVICHYRDCKSTHWVVYNNGLYFDPAAGIVVEYPDGVRETSCLPIFEIKAAINNDTTRPGRAGEAPL